MHKDLDRVWNEVYRILKNGGIACINIGDATRTIRDSFALYPNHSRILAHMVQIGFTALPVILWRKQTNAPNKFMGSGMLPPGAYVTLEHEYILILRKKYKREFDTLKQKEERRESALFWEERNVWFSDIWMDVKGTRQKTPDNIVRKRSAAFPFEVPYRLVNMFSVKGDTVVDPFFGMGTTMHAAMAACRNSIGYEIDMGFKDSIIAGIDNIVPFSNTHISNRIKNHIAFINDRFKTAGKFKYENRHYRFPVISNQETKLLLNRLVSLKKSGDNSFEVTYANKPQEEFCRNWEDFILPEKDKT
jgi:DNA modification methylase